MDTPLNRRGQFIPMAALVMLSVVVFMVGVVNVFTVSRAKLRAQNLADAAANFVAGQMVESLNTIADRNESMNHIYGDPNDASFSTAGHDPCQPPGNRSQVPPGIGCFAIHHEGSFKFGDVQAAQAFANLINTVNQVQLQYQSVFNSLMSAQNGVTTSANAPNAFQANLYSAIPDFANDPNVQVLVYNSAAGENSASRDADALDQQQKNAPTAAPPSGLIQSVPLNPILYTIHPINVTYWFGLNLTGTKTSSLQDLMGSNSPIGYMEVDPRSYWTPPGSSRSPGGEMAAGAIVRITVKLMGLGAQTVQARSKVYVIMKSGSVGPTAKGLFQPTYLLKMGKPI